MVWVWDDEYLCIVCCNTCTCGVVWVWDDVCFCIVRCDTCGVVWVRDDGDLVL